MILNDLNFRIWQEINELAELKVCYERKAGLGLWYVNLRGVGQFHSRVNVKSFFQTNFTFTY